MNLDLLIAAFQENDWQIVETDKTSIHLTKRDNGQDLQCFAVETEALLEYAIIINNIAMPSLTTANVVNADAEYHRQLLSTADVVKQCQRVPPQYQPDFYKFRTRQCETCETGIAEPRITICKACVQKQVDELFVNF